MKTIEERASEYYKDAQRRDELYNEEGDMYSCVPKMAFIAGAKSEHEELTRWIPFNEECPISGKNVLIKIRRPHETLEYVSMVRYISPGKFEIFEEEVACLLYECGYEVIGWREIHE